MRVRQLVVCLLALHGECCILWRVASYTFISPTKITIIFGTVRPTDDNAWKPAKWAKFMLVLTITNKKPLRVRTYKNTVTTDLKNKLYYMASIVRAPWLAAERALFSCNDRALWDFSLARRLFWVVSKTTCGGQKQQKRWTKYLQLYFQ